MSQQNEFPLLPLEIEREIFETCAVRRPISIPTLMLVAWPMARERMVCLFLHVCWAKYSSERRIEYRVEPLLFRTIAVGFSVSLEPYPIFTWKALLSAVRSKPASFFHTAVRNLCVLDDSLYASTEEVFAACTGVANFSLWSDLPPTQFAHLRPTRLTSTVAKLFPLLPPTHNFFSWLTHLEVRHNSLPPEAPGDLKLLPALTHLAVYDFRTEDIQELFDVCTRLQVLVALFQRTAPTIHDRRFVAMVNGGQLADWQMAAYLGEDYWTLAEQIVARRPPGPVNDSLIRFSIGVSFRQIRAWYRQTGNARPSDLTAIPSAILYFQQFGSYVPEFSPSSLFQLLTYSTPHILAAAHHDPPSAVTSRMTTTKAP
ncbi:hypothetical protein R3P38DRAFT_3223330 [Favolaschia claudopus]|uniref:Uncharacterized protein n=1 Tax=Favolaschia claudopus TaxID=2862362 RepID=A0AAV9ZX66_9AGAR